MATDTRNPTSDEGFSGIVDGTGGLRYTDVDDYPDTGAGRTVRTFGPSILAANITFGFTAFSVPTGSTSISIDVLYHDETSGATTLGGRLKVGGNYYNATEHSVSTLTARDDAWATNPKSASAWTVDDVNGVGTNALQAFGVRTSDCNPAVKISDILLQVTYTPPTTHIKSINGLANASIKSVNGLARASIKSINGLT